MMKEGELKTGYVVADPAKLTVGTVSIWENEDKFNAVANTDPYKALIGRLKYSTRNVYLLNLQ
jgi:heme-degrading monooxygenase HmoA